MWHAYGVDEHFPLVWPPHSTYMYDFLKVKKPYILWIYTESVGDRWKVENVPLYF